jgi:hypothetical protein
VFREVFETLKGGGQITVVEGNKAQIALSRLQLEEDKYFPEDIEAVHAALDELEAWAKETLALSEEIVFGPQGRTNRYQWGG